MKIKLLLGILLINCFVCFSQSELAKKGVITLADNQKIAFNNVRLQDGKFVFFDIKSGTESSLAISEIKYIEDDNDSKVFTNKTVVDRTREADLKLAAEQKKIAIEEETKKAAAFKQKLEDEKKALAMGLYPNGIYTTKEDFINKIPNNSDELVPKEVVDLDKSILYGIPDECFFYDLKSDKKIKNAFAVSYRGHLYFQIGAILENRNKTDRAQSNDHPNSFVKVKSYGDNYYYSEAELANMWAQGIAAGVGGVVVGVAVATTMNREKGIVWDIKNKEFNIFKNCLDFNDFIKDKYPEGVQKCDTQQPDIVLVRKAIEKIK
jgi:hypothetical protein